MDSSDPTLSSLLNTVSLNSMDSIDHFFPLSPPSTGIPISSFYSMIIILQMSQMVIFHQEKRRKLKRKRRNISVRDVSIMIFIILERDIRMSASQSMILFVYRNPSSSSDTLIVRALRVQWLNREDN